MPRTRTDDLLLGEWACLGILTVGPSHGYDVAVRLSARGDVGRAWTLSRPLTYRALDQLVQRGLVEVVGEEPGTAGGNRTVLAATRRGTSLLRSWLREPVTHLRDVRGELMVKLLLCELTGTDPAAVLAAQRRAFEPVAARLAEDASERRADRAERGRPGRGVAARVGAGDIAIPRPDAGGELGHRDRRGRLPGVITSPDGAALVIS